MIHVGYSARCARGRGIDDCVYLAARVDTAVGFEIGEAESWIIRARGERDEPLRADLGLHTDLWRSPTGTAYVADLHRGVFVCPDPAAGAEWYEHQLPFPVRGVFGLADDLVWAWGETRAGGCLARFDGMSFREVEAPGRIHAMHGNAVDLLVAVGEAGLVARFDGGRWTKLRTSTDTTLSSVWVESADEVYVCGAERRLFEGSVHGMSEVLIAPGPLLSVVKWWGKVWLAGGATGGNLELCRLERDRLETVDIDIAPTSLSIGDARLVVSAPTAVAETLDGQSFRYRSLEAFASSIRGRVPLFAGEGASWEDAPGISSALFDKFRT